jgi:hypothetical protein
MCGESGALYALAPACAVHTHSACLPRVALPDLAAAIHLVTSKPHHNITSCCCALPAADCCATYSAARHDNSLTAVQGYCRQRTVEHLEQELAKHVRSK